MSTDAASAAETATAAIARLLAEAAVHPDPWFSAVAKSYLAPKPVEEGIDVALVSRLEAQAASGEYTTLDVTTDDVEVPGPHGPVPVRVYRPRSAEQGTPVLVWCHGGGFMGGDLDMPEADATAREIVQRAGAVVVSVDYRLAVRGVHFPVPHDDAHAAYLWAAEALGASRCVIGGASAGANLAAGVALRLRDEGRGPLGVMLLYPLVHPEVPAPSDELAEKLAVLPGGHAFRPDTIKPVVENYLGAPVAEAHPYAMAGLADLRQFPPTLVINCEYDGLRASGEAFTASLEAAGVQVTQLLAPDVLHGHINSPWLAQAQQSYADMAAWLTSLAAG